MREKVWMRRWQVMKIALLGTIVLLCGLLNAKALALYSNCPKVSIAVPSNVLGPDGKIRKCSGTLLRASRIVGNFPMVPDTGGQKDYSSKSGLFLYEHILFGLQRFVSIRWARNQSYALLEENEKLQFKMVTQNKTIPPDKFLFRQLSLPNQYRSFRTKSSKRFLVYSYRNCSVRLSDSSYDVQKKAFHKFRVTCQKLIKGHNCICFPISNRKD